MQHHYYFQIWLGLTHCVLSNIKYFTFLSSLADFFFLYKL